MNDFLMFYVLISKMWLKYWWYGLFCLWLVLFIDLFVFIRNFFVNYDKKREYKINLYVYV